MSKVCTFIAETCGKCTQLKACFWCSDNGEGRGSCYAENDLSAKQKCIGKLSAYWEKEPCTGSHDYLPPNDNAERSVLIKLLLLLTKLRDSKNKHHIEGEQKNAFINENKSEVHNQVGEMPNKESTNEVGSLSNSSMMDNNNNNNNNNNVNINNNQNNSNTANRGYQRNVSTTDNGNTSTTIHNSTQHNEKSKSKSKSKSVLSRNGTVTHNVLLPLTNRTSGTSIQLPCYMKNQSSCFMNHSCSWCENNGTCCRTRELKLKEEVVLPHIVSKSGTKVGLCPARSSCETCVSDIKCYWCQPASTCKLYPGKSYVNAQCRGKVHHQTCSQDIPVYVFALCIILVTFFLSVGYLCARKCYYFQLKPVEVKLEERPILFKQKNGRTVYQITESEEEDEEELYRSGKDSYTPSKVGAAPNNPAVW